MILKRCFRCSKQKDIEDFYKHPMMKDGHLGKCKECARLDVRLNRIKRGDSHREGKKQDYRLNLRTLFLARYGGMMGRIRGMKNRNDSVRGREILEKEEFLEWCYEKKNYKKFLKIHKNWLKSGFKRKLAPSIDRIDNAQSYLLDNLQWLTQIENSSKYTRQTYGKNLNRY